MDWSPKLRGGAREGGGGGLYLNKKTFGMIFINCQNSK